MIHFAKRDLFTALLLICLPGLLVAQMAEHYTQQGLEYVEKKQYKEAISSFSQALRNDVNYYNAYFYRGEVYKKLDQFDKAYRDFSMYANAEKTVFAYFQRGLLLETFGKYALAIKDYSRAINLDYLSKDYYIYYRRGKMYLATNQDFLARADFKQLIAKSSGDTSYRGLVGICHWFLGNKTEGIRLIEEDIRTGKNRAIAYFNKANLYSLQKKHEAALNYLEKAFEHGYDNFIYLKHNKYFLRFHDIPGYSCLLARYDKTAPPCEDILRLEEEERAEKALKNSIRKKTTLLYVKQWLPKSENPGQILQLGIKNKSPFPVRNISVKLLGNGGRVIEEKAIPEIHPDQMEFVEFFVLNARQWGYPLSMSISMNGELMKILKKLDFPK